MSHVFPHLVTVFMKVMVKRRMRGSTRSQSERSTFKRIKPHIQRIEADFDKHLDGKHRLAEYVWTRWDGDLSETGKESRHG